MTASLDVIAHNLPRTLFFGMPGVFSYVVLNALLRAHAPVCAVILPAATPAAPPVVLRPAPPSGLPDDDLPLLTTFVAPTTLHLAWQHKLPVYEVGGLNSPAVAALIRTLVPEVACVACFSKRIPASLLTLPRYGFLNVHPSLLPAYRGPAPLFWQLRAGEPRTGVTVHWMDATLDTGDIAAQAPLQWPDGLAGPKIDELCAKAGGELLLQVLNALATGQTSRTTQSDNSTVQPWPQAADFTLHAEWSARHAYNFMRGTAEWGQPYAVDVVGERLWLSNALSYTREVLGQPSMRNGDVVQIQFSPGVLLAQLVGA
ncbi:MAG: formyltransferase family protein [Chloroflexi bacterium]|nr:formyltransferase family protein [Chloroflexota bacterium]